jgi:hypothetical protein
MRYGRAVSFASSRDISASFDAFKDDLTPTQRRRIPKVDRANQDVEVHMSEPPGLQRASSMD